ncbi:MAG: DNA modification methylase [Actinophytocola sp.]|nr:DNA modification methylase [Actinophytocola sp.]
MARAVVAGRKAASVVSDRERSCRPASVWATGDIALRDQLADRYVAATRAAAVAMTPAVARRIILTYTAPGDTVLDPNPTAGIALAEAVRASRHAVGFQPRQPRWQSVCDANLKVAWLAGAPVPARMLTGAADPQIANLPTAIDLALTGILLKPDGTDYHRALIDLHDDLRGVIDWVWPSGHIVITCRTWHTRHGLLDLPGEVDDVARSIGLVPHDRCVALTSRLDAGRDAAARAHLHVLVYTTRAARAPATVVRVPGTACSVEELA